MVTVMAAVLPVILTGIFGILAKMMDGNKKSKKISDRVHTVLMRSELRQIYNACKQVHFCGDDDFQQFSEIYEIYHELGGNGLATVWLEELKEMR